VVLTCDRFERHFNRFNVPKGREEHPNIRLLDLVVQGADIDAVGDG
jgi:hypothetical protein